MRKPSGLPKKKSSSRPAISKGSARLTLETDAKQLTAKRLLAWYRLNRRDLPWRRHHDPYAVWVSEVMLQQTQVSTAEPYFRRWLERFPTVRALADADEAQVLHCWQGLGYYSRARALLRGAQLVVAEHQGELPKTRDELLKLPGIGPYTAGAIASIAYEQDEPIVDGNVIRVLTRRFGLKGDPQKAPLKQQLWDLSRSLIPSGQARDFNQALMEIGALVCTPKRPRCADCPLSAECTAKAQDDVERYPETAPRPQVTEVYVSAALARRGRRVLVIQLHPDAPRWASMWQFPNLESPIPNAQKVNSPKAPTTEAARQALAARALTHFTGLTADPEKRLHELKHAVTRYRIHLALYPCSAPKGRLRAAHCAGAKWVPIEELPDLAMPAAHRRLARALAGDTL